MELVDMVTLPVFLFHAREPGFVLGLCSRIAQVTFLQRLVDLSSDKEKDGAAAVAFSLTLIQVQCGVAVRCGTVRCRAVHCRAVLASYSQVGGRIISRPPSCR